MSSHWKVDSNWPNSWYQTNYIWLQAAILNSLDGTLELRLATDNCILQLDES